MRLETQYVPEKMICTDASRTTICHAYLDLAGTDQWLVATDSHAMVVVPIVADPGDTAGAVSTDSLKRARALAKAGKLAELSVGANGALMLADGGSLPRPADGVFPTWREVLPASDRPEAMISFNTKLLATLASALGSEIVTLGISCTEDGGIDRLAPIRVIPRDGAAVGVLMPCRDKAAKS